MLKKDIVHTVHKGESSEQLVTWLEAGVYDVVRLFDKDRVLIDVSQTGVKQYTIVHIRRGTLS